MPAAASAPVPGGIRLSPQQRRSWSLQSTGAATPVRGLVRLDGPLDPERLRRAVEGVVRRHEMLRTVFQSDHRLKFPLQVTSEATAGWRAIDLTGQSPGERQRAVESLWRETAGRRFDLELGPMVDLVLVRSAEQRHHLCVASSPLAADRWTVRLLVRGLARAYEEGADRSRALVPPVQYAEFSAWANQLLAEANRTPVRTAAAPVLPFEGPPGGGAALPEVLELESGAAIAQGLATLAGELGTSLAAVLLAAWQMQLGRLTGRRELGLVLSSSGRGVEDLAEVMGPVATWLPVRCAVEESLPFARLAGQAEGALAEAAADLLLDVEPEARALGESVGFTCEELPDAALAHGLSWRLERLCAGLAGSKLALSIARVPDGTGLRLALAYDARRISAESAAELTDQYLALLGSLASGGHPAAGRASLLGRDKRAALLDAGRGPRPSSPPPWRLHEAFEAQAERLPGLPAVVCGAERLTYDELNRRANRVAHHLIRRGVGPGTPVGLCCERSAGMIVGLLGILKAGGAYVPLDPHAPPERLAEQIRQGGFSIAITNGEGDARLPAHACALLSLEERALLDAEPATNPGVLVPLDELGSVIFTSGSTGVPKGVAITHRGMASYTRALCEAFQVEAGWHFATVSTLSADLGNTSIFASLATGGCLHVIDYETATDGRRFADYCRRCPIDALKIVPSHLGALLEIAPEVLPRRLLVLGGETLPLALADRVAALSDCAVANHYGPTETTVGVLVLPLSDLRDRRGCASVPVGRPLANAEAYVLDECLEPAPTGIVGELYLGGAGLARGYLGRSELTAERFVPHPFADGGRLYRTGDRARYRPDGTIEFMGRGDHQVKIRGFRVELGEIEARLREHPAVAHAVVVMGEEGGAAGVLLAYVVPRTDRHAACADEGLRAFLRERLPDYMVPAQFVALPALPLTANGKIDRRALPRPGNPRGKRQHIPPRTPVEETIARIWAEMLRVPQVGVEDDFFELGGHSLLAIPLIYRIQKALGSSLSLMAIFQAPTVAGLARLLATQPPVGGPVPLRGAGGRPPLFCVDPTGRHARAYQPLADALAEDQPVFAVELAPALEAQGAGAGAGVSIAGITEHMAAEIRQRQPHGPYHLLGWSLGGILAVAVARALESRGDTVSFLGILDTNPRAGLYGADRPDPVDELAAYLEPERRAELLALPPAKLEELRVRLTTLDGEQRVQQAVTWAQAHGFLPDATPAAALLGRHALLREAALFMAQLPARALRAPIHAWWSSETLSLHGAPPFDWQHCTTGPFVPGTVSGDHLAALQGPEVHEQIRTALETLLSSD